MKVNGNNINDHRMASIERLAQDYNSGELKSMYRLKEVDDKGYKITSTKGRYLSGDQFFSDP